MSKALDYFTNKEILSTTCLYGLVQSDRSDGKTFNCKFSAWQDFKNNGWVTVYVRRWKTEITPPMYKLFIQELYDVYEKYKTVYGFDEIFTEADYNILQKTQFKSSANGIQIKLPDMKEFKDMIYFCRLSISSKAKSSWRVENIRRIYFDEYLPLDGRYLPKEMDFVTELYKSCDRDRECVQLLCLGNRITPFNPFMNFFGITLSINNERLKTYRENTVAVQIYVSKHLREIRDKGRLKTLLKGTSYENYDNGGVLNAYNIPVMKRDNAEYWGRFKTEVGSGTIWRKEGYFIISTKTRKDGFCIVDKFHNDITNDSYLITYGKFPTLFKNIYKTNRLCYEDDKSYNYFSPLLTKLCI